MSLKSHFARTWLFWWSVVFGSIAAIFLIFGVGAPWWQGFVLGFHACMAFVTATDNIPADRRTRP